MGTSDTVRVGILGAGFMGSAHAECYDLLDIPIAMIASRSPGTIAGRPPRHALVSRHRGSHQRRRGRLH